MMSSWVYILGFEKVHDFAVVSLMQFRFHGAVYNNSHIMICVPFAPDQRGILSAKVSSMAAGPQAKMCMLPVVLIEIRN